MLNEQAVESWTVDNPKQENILLCVTPNLKLSPEFGQTYFFPESSYYPSPVTSMDGFNDVNPEIIEVLRGRNVPMDDCFVWM